MTAPSVLTEASSKNESADVTVHPATLPGSLVVGKRLVWATSIDGNANGISVQPSGWSVAEAYFTAGSNQVHGVVWEKAVDGSEGATVQFETTSFQRSASHIWQIDGSDMGTPIEVNINTANDATVNPDPPSMTPSWGQKDTLFIAVSGKDNGGSTYTGWPAGYGGTFEINMNGFASGGVCLGGAYKAANVTTEDPGTFTIGSTTQSRFALTIAIPPAADPPMTAAANDVASATAALNTSINLAAAASGVSASAASLATAIQLALAAVSNAAASGVLTTQIRLAANAQDVATAVGNFGGAVLTAAAFDVATSVAALTTSIRLGGIAQDQASMTAALTNWATVTLAGVLYTGAGSVLDPSFWLDDVPQLGTTLYFDPTNIDIAPNGEISSNSNDCTAVVQFLGPNGWAKGLVIVTPKMVGYARDTVTATGQLTTAIQLIAAANALATAAANLSTGAGISAAAVDQASASANLVTGIPLSALITAVSTATAALTAQIQLAASAQSQATATANLNGVISLNAAGQAIATLVANLTTQVRLAGAAQDQATVTAALTSAIRLGATGQSVVSAAGSLSTAITLGGHASDVVSSSADLSTARPLIAAAIDVATAIATLSTGINLRANAAAIAQATAQLDAGLALLADARAEATATAELTDVIANPPIGAYETDEDYVVRRSRWSFLPLLVFTPRFSRKDPSDTVVLTFDLSGWLAANEKLQGPITITIRSVAGSDASPQTLQRDVPSYDVARKKILLPVGGGIGGNWYYIKVHAETSNPRKSVSLAGLLPVME